MDIIFNRHPNCEVIVDSSDPDFRYGKWEDERMSLIYAINRQYGMGWTEYDLDGNVVCTQALLSEIISADVKLAKDFLIEYDRVNNVFYVSVAEYVGAVNYTVIKKD